MNEVSTATRSTRIEERKNNEEIKREKRSEKKRRKEGHMEEVKEGEKEGKKERDNKEKKKEGRTETRYHFFNASISYHIPLFSMLQSLLISHEFPFSKHH